MVVAGLTGSIAMGKSTVAAMFAALGAAVFDADAAVRDFYFADGAKAVEDIFPGIVVGGRIDRDRLSQLVLGDAAALARLERLVHPVVATARAQFVERAAIEGRRLTVVDVPLLFETGGEFELRPCRRRERVRSGSARPSLGARRHDRSQTRRHTGAPDE